MTTLDLIGVQQNIADLVIYSFRAPNGDTFDLMTSVSEAEYLGLNGIKTVCVDKECLNIDIPLLSASDIADFDDLIPEDHSQIEHIIASGDDFIFETIDRAEQ